MNKTETTALVSARMQEIIDEETEAAKQKYAKEIKKLRTRYDEIMKEHEQTKKELEKIEEEVRKVAKDTQEANKDHPHLEIRANTRFSPASLEVKLKERYSLYTPWQKTAQAGSLIRDLMTLRKATNKRVQEAAKVGMQIMHGAKDTKLIDKLLDI